MKRLLFLIACSLLITSAFLQCKRCKDKSLGDHSLTQTDLSTVPYVGTETLVFKDLASDSVIYHGSGRSSVINGAPNVPGQKCTGDYYNTEVNHTQFIASINHRSIDLYLSFYDTLASTFYKYINIGLDYPSTLEGHFQARYYFDNLKLTQDNSNGRILAFDDSLMIGPKKFYSVYTLSEIPDTNKIVYYSLVRGVVGFVTSAGNLRYLAH
jgi:hypothetical protein